MEEIADCHLSVSDDRMEPMDTGKWTHGNSYLTRRLHRKCKKSIMSFSDIWLATRE